MGNVRSVQKAVIRLGYECIVTHEKKILSKADRLILPGVGHFTKGMENLLKFDLVDSLNEIILSDKKPLLGICLGMQLLTNFSEEGNCAGLGWIDATTRYFSFSDHKYKVPHIGWNSITIQKESKLLNGIPNDSHFYFVHSYFVECSNAEDILTTSDYCISFTSAIEKENIYAVQFHPEKSHDAGLQLISNFLQLP